MAINRCVGMLVVTAMIFGIAGCGAKPASVVPVVQTSPSPDRQPTTAATNKSPSKSGPAAQADRDLVDKVSRRLLAVMDRLPAFVKQPTFEIINEDKINAYATATVEGTGRETKVLPKVVVYDGLLKRVIKGNDDPEGAEDRLSFILGHELGHVLLAHIVRRPPGETAFVQQVFSRDQESKADLKGMEMALKAGFSFRRARSAITRMKSLGLDYSSFEGLGVDHPSWNDRFALMDKEQPTLWKAMSSFENGTFFLLFEQYAAAERCFQQVTKEFPECYEAWNNLGYALLMQYCDGLEPADLRQFGIGQIVVGGFYARPKSLETLVRGQDEKLWKAAVESLERALKLKPDLVLPKGNLGVAYLVSPQGKDVKKAKQYFQDALDEMRADQELTPLARAAILINAGVADLAAGQPKEGSAKFTQGQETCRESAGDLPRAPATAALFSALCYNRGLLLAASPEEKFQRQAVTEFGRYLRATSRASAWWPLAYERYVRLCNGLGVEATEKSQLVGPNQGRVRLITSVKVDPKTLIMLSEPMTDVISRLGAGHKIPIVQGTKLVRVCYPDHGLELLAADRVLAIRLRGPKAPALPIQDTGLGGGTQTLRLGMSQQELDGILKNQALEQRQLDRADVQYRFYPDVGLAVRLHEEKIEELVIAQIPRRRGGEE